MRRSHPGLGGWRNENPRHFRPRNGGNQHFRPPRGYSLLDQHRFPPPVPRPQGPSIPYKYRSSGCDDRPRHDHYRGKFRSEYRPKNYSRNHDESRLPKDKHIYSMAHTSRSTETPYNYSNLYPPEPSVYYGGPSKHCHMNSMGDIDDRYVPPREPFRQNSILPWACDSNCNKLDDRHTAHRYDQSNFNIHDGGESSKLPSYDYTGHRPPSNDHYGGKPTPVTNNSGSFNRSVDDTVDLIRKRLLNRNDSHSETIESNYTHNPIDNPMIDRTKENIQNLQQDQPSKKKVNRQRPSDNANNDASFTKIKSKIVNQLFKMDKEKIHKLMDNPNSSSKFEYAISSLITESQYSFNRHLRSVAEKSLHTSSSIDCIQNDNNTIYEDTFMKQMQCILDPQDTILLEDIKPIVMAELSKALQLHEYEQQFDVADDELHQQRYEQSNYSNEHYDHLLNYDDYTPLSDNPDQKIPITQINHTHTQIAQTSNDAHNQDYEEKQIKDYNVNDNIYESRTRRRSCNLSSEGMSVMECPPYLRKSLDGRLNDPFTTNTHSNPENPLFASKPDGQRLFVPDTEPIEDEDDPFAELDNQYHVAVDHSFIDNDDSSSLKLEKDYVQPTSPNSIANITLNLDTKEKESLIQEIDNQLQNMANSPLKLPSFGDDQIKDQISEINKNLVPVQNESKCDNYLINTYNIEKPTSTKASDDIKFTEAKREVEKTDTSHISHKSSAASKSRKRSIDQSPSHRKEKRKKSNSVCHDSEKQIVDKNIIVTTNENSSKLPKKEQDKQSFSEKHAKRKELLKKTDQKDDETRNKPNSTESLNSSINSKEINNSNNNNKPHTKSEVKTTLKTFDLFTEQPKKISIHHAHRNTALAPTSAIKIVSEPKIKKQSKLVKINPPIQSGKIMHSVYTQTIEPRTTCSRFPQTDKKKYVAKATQTDIVPSLPIKKDTTTKATEPLERMKEIDMEIQILLQEKFKLYNSIESIEYAKNSLTTLGMAVLNVTPNMQQVMNNLSENVVDENTQSEDSIVNAFTNIPVEELHQIAIEAIEAEQAEDPKPAATNRQLRVLSREKSKSQSPTPPNQKKSKKKGKTPNISLIEQIISDERPIEEIISLDDLENTPGKTRAKSIKSKRKTTRKSPVEINPSTLLDSKDITLKECSVLVVREDFSKYLPAVEPVKLDVLPIDTETVIEPHNSYSEVPIVNDIHFDMLDVSEDIVIGDICEVKSVNDKEELGTTDISVTEDIILDNSQSSIEEHQGCNSDTKDNECKVFDYSSDENLRRDSIVVTGNADAVLAVECIENNFVAACLDGNVYYFSGDGQLISTLRGSNLAVTCITIVKEKYGTTVYTGSLDSRIRYYDLDTGLEKGPECNVLSPIQTMDRAWDTVFVGTRTGFVLQFECKNNMLIPISTVQFSEQSILALRAMKEGPRKVLLVAARSEDVTIKDAQTGLLLRTLAGPKMTVYTLLYEDGKVYCGTSTNQVHVFDYSSGTHVGAHEGGKGAVCLRASGGLLFAGCYDGCVYVYREGERRPFAQLRGPSLMLLSLAVVGSKIIAGYKDRSLYIWKIPLSILQEMIL